MEYIFEKNLIELFNKHVPKVKNYNMKSEEMLNHVYLFHQGLEKVQFKESIDWNYEHNVSANTYQLYLHTLNFTKSLVYSFLESSEIKYISKAKNIFEDWLIHNSISDHHLNTYAWYDHTTASRLTNLLFYQANAPEKYKIKREIFEDTFAKHINFLANEDNYPHNNHGIMMDRSLILSSIFIKDETLKSRYINVAKQRIESAILRDYSYMNTHLENSPDYHVMVTSWLTKINNLLKAINYPLKRKYQEKLKGAVSYNSIVANYANQFPMLGDTSAGKSKEKKSDEDFIDLEAGIAVFNDRTKKSTLVFNCGFQNHTHKHRDDLSFVFSINKEEIFVDSGKYNYLISDPIRKYMVSPKAHTLLYVENKGYPLSPSEDLSIKAFIVNDNYKYVAAVNHLYKDISLIRHIIIINGDMLIIYDEIISENQNVYAQNFILGEEFKCNKVHNKFFEIYSPDNSYCLKEHTDKGMGRLYYGKSESNPAIISKKFNSIIDVNRIELKKKTTSTNFLTTFSTDSTLIENVKVENSILRLKVNNTNFEVHLYNEQ